MTKCDSCNNEAINFALEKKIFRHIKLRICQNCFTTGKMDREPYPLAVKERLMKITQDKILEALEEIDSIFKTPDPFHTPF